MSDSSASTGSSGPIRPHSGLLAPLRLPRPILKPSETVKTRSDQGVRTAPLDSVDLSSGAAGGVGGVGGIAALEQTAHQAAQRVDELDRVGGLITEVQGLIREAQRSGDATTISNIQARVDQIIGAIGRAESAVTEAAGGRQPLPTELGLSYSLVRNEAITTRASGAFNGAPPADVNLDVEVTTSAQQAGFILSFGAGDLNLGGAIGSDGARNQFVIEIAGDKGVRELSFASGTQIESIAAAIDSFTDVTGVRAVVSGSRILVKSEDFGRDEFVSVRVNDNGQLNITHAYAGLYRLQPGDANQANPADGILFSALSNSATDHGQDVQATIGGVPATTRGLNVIANTPQWRINLDLTASFASNLQPPTLAATFQPRTLPDGEAPSGSAPGADQNAPGVVERVSASFDSLRAQASDRLAGAREEVRAATRALAGANPSPASLDALVQYRRSLLGDSAV